MRLWACLVVLAACAPAPARTAPPPPVAPVASVEADAAPAPPRDTWTPRFATYGSTSTRTKPAKLGKDVSMPVADQKFLVHLERTACRDGDCPAYAVEIAADGAVLFIDHDSPHQATGTVTAAEIAKLTKRFRDAGFFRMMFKSPCGIDPPTDTPSARMTFVDQGRMRTIEDDHGDGCIPDIVGELENEIDRVGATAVWRH